MKIITAQEMARIESLAYQAGFKEEDFMEAAGRGVATRARSYLSSDEEVLLVAGKGNNAGDGYVAGCYLLKEGFSVSVFTVFEEGEKESPLCEKMKKRFFECGGKRAKSLSLQKGIFIDGIFGTGFKNTTLCPSVQSAISQLNQSQKTILSIDIPSGLEGSTGRASNPCVMATETIYLGLPKWGFFINDGWKHVGELHFVNFGLPKEFVDQAQSSGELLELKELSHLMPKLSKDAHKYSRGAVVGISGMQSMMGASELSGMGALTAGAGIVHLFHPFIKNIETTQYPELIHFGWDEEEVFKYVKRAQSGFVGPGTDAGNQEWKDALLNIAAKLSKPFVFDGGALMPGMSYPKGSVLTPHLGELERLCGQKLENAQEAIEAAKEISLSKSVIVLVKGSPTFIVNQSKVSVMPFGGPELATAGSGDVLTGMIASLMAQGLSPFDAACLGASLHALSARLAKEALSPYAVTASKLIEHLPEAQNALLRLNTV